MIKALFFDIDGTLVSFRTHAVPQSTIDAVAEARRRGVKVVVATGRTRPCLPPLEGLVFDGYLTVNGAACITDEGFQIVDARIDDRLLDAAMRESARLDFAMGVLTDEGLFVDRVTPEVRLLADVVGLELPEVGDLKALAHRSPCRQLCFYTDAERGREALRDIPELVASRWHPEFADVNLRSVNKGTGIEAFMRHWGLQRDEVMAFGDGGNDVAMLATAGVGVAMGGACDEAKAVADFVADTVENDGIAKALRRYGVIG